MSEPVLSEEQKDVLRKVGRAEVYGNGVVYRHCGADITTLVQELLDLGLIRTAEAWEPLNPTGPGKRLLKALWEAEPPPPPKEPYDDDAGPA